MTGDDAKPHRPELCNDAADQWIVGCSCSDMIETRAPDPETACQIYAKHIYEIAWNRGHSVGRSRAEAEPSDPTAAALIDRRATALNLTIAYYDRLAKTRLILPKRQDCDLAVEIEPALPELLATAATIDDYLAAGVLPTEVRTCRQCGCTDYAACDPPCWWVDEDLCSACDEVVQPPEREVVTVSSPLLSDPAGTGGDQ